MDENKVIDQISKTLEEGVEKDIATLKDELADTQAELKSLKGTKAKANGAHKKAIVSLVKSVLVNGENFQQAKAKALTEGTDGQGGEFVFDEFEKDVLQVINEEPVLNEVKMYNTNGDVLKLPKYSNGVVTTFEAEGTGGAASQGTTSYITLNIKRAVTNLEISEELMQDSMTIPDIYEIIVRDIGESQANFLARQILQGDGTGDNFLGIYNAPGVNEVVLDAGKTSVKDLGDSDLVATMTAAKRKFKKNKANLAWVMSEYVFGVIASIKTTTGQYLYPEMRNETPTLLGRKVILSDQSTVQDASEDGASTPFLIFGDLKYFALAKNNGLEIETGYVNDNFNRSIKTVRSKSRVAGEITYPEAFTRVVTAA